MRIPFRVSPEARVAVAEATIQRGLSQLEVASTAATAEYTNLDLTIDALTDRIAVYQIRQNQVVALKKAADQRLASFRKLLG
jgi:hypothetical protein